MRSVRGVLLAVCAVAMTTSAADPYPRAGWVAYIPHGAHSVVGIATIIDERTIQIDHFTCDGGAPAVYFYLGAHDEYNDFLNGIPIGPQLNRPYDDETVLAQLDPGQTLDGYEAISVWCVAAHANFSSASFVAPGTCPGDLNGDGQRNVTDFTLFAAAYGSQIGDANYDPNADLSGNGFVNATDFSQFASYYGTPCP
jgi:hypothetical protein